MNCSRLRFSVQLEPKRKSLFILKQASVLCYDHCLCAVTATYDVKAACISEVSEKLPHYHGDLNILVEICF
jgi:hypothetical protein